MFSYYLPESPLWLVKRGHEEDARESIAQLRGPGYQTSHEIKELILCTLVAQPIVLEEAASDLSFFRVRMNRLKSTVGLKLSAMCSPDVWKPQMLVGILLLFQVNRVRHLQVICRNSKMSFLGLQRR
jgi:hypothetical protein